MTPFDGLPASRAAAPAAESGPYRAGSAGPVRGPVAALARVVLALATGLPLRSVGRLVPDAGEQAGPFLGV